MPRTNGDMENSKEPGKKDVAQKERGPKGAGGGSERTAGDKKGGVGGRGVKKAEHASVELEG